MHPKIITQRSKSAENRLIEALNRIADVVGVEPAASVKHRDSDIRNMSTLEVMADKAEQIAAIICAQPLPTDSTDSDEPEPMAVPKRGRKAKATE